jgi:serine protease Do
MRVAIGLALTLAIALGASEPCAAGSFQLDVPPPAAVTPLDTAVAVAPVSFARIAANLPDGKVFAKFLAPIPCLAPAIARADELHWRSTMNRFSDPDFERIFRAELGNAGFKVTGDPTDLFRSGEETSDLQVGALITDFQVRGCYRGPSSAIAEVEWQIYSTVADKIVARIPTRGGVKGETASKTGEVLVALLQKSFGENVRQLAADSNFRRIVLEAHSSVAATVPRPSLPVAYRTGGTPVPLKDAANGAVTIFAGDGMGSGVLISTDGYILTNHHVASSGRVRVRWPDNSESIGEVVRADSRRDVALIKVDKRKGIVLAMRHTPVDLGETVYAIGTPLDKSLQNTVTRGIVSATRVMDGLSFIQSDTPVTHGNSGGPLVDERGAVVGLSDLGLDPSQGSTINFFIPINDALKVLGLTPAA